MQEQVKREQDEARAKLRAGLEERITEVQPGTISPEEIKMEIEGDVEEMQKKRLASYSLEYENKASAKALTDIDKRLQELKFEGTKAQINDDKATEKALLEVHEKIFEKAVSDKVAELIKNQRNFNDIDTRLELAIQDTNELASSKKDIELNEAIIYQTALGRIKKDLLRKLAA